MIDTTPLLEFIEYHIIRVNTDKTMMECNGLDLCYDSDEDYSKYYDCSDYNCYDMNRYDDIPDDNSRYDNNCYDEDEKLYGFTDDWETYYSSIYD